MLKHYAKAELIDGLEKNNLFLEVNFDENNKDLVKVTLSDKVCVIKRDDLWNFVFSIVEADKQQKIVPVIKQEMIRYQKEHQIELQRDMKKGEIVIAHCAVNVKEEVDQAMRRELEEEKLSTERTKSPYLQK